MPVMCELCQYVHVVSLSAHATFSSDPLVGRSQCTGVDRDGNAWTHPLTSFPSLWKKKNQVLKYNENIEFSLDIDEEHNDPMPSEYG